MCECVYLPIVWIPLSEKQDAEICTSPCYNSAYAYVNAFAENDNENNNFYNQTSKKTPSFRAPKKGISTKFGVVEVLLFHIK